jgi:hypothetical protein
MADVKITELTELTTPQDTDVMPIVDNSGTPTTKKSTWANIKATLKTYFDSIYQAALGFTAENAANKSTNVTTDGASDTKYPSVKSVKDYADGIVAGLLDYRGAYDASVNTYPAAGGSGAEGAVMKGDMWVISVAGTLGGAAIQIGDSIIANIDTPGQTAGNWNTLNTNLSYVPEDSANKKTTLADDSDTYYPSQKAVKTAVDAKEDAANKETSALDTSTTKYPCNNVVKTAVDAKAPKDITINTQETDAYTLVLADDGKLVDIDYATAATLTVPKNAVVAFPIGTIIAIRQKGAGVVTIAPVDEDVTISYAEGLDTTGQHAMAALVKVAENTWVATGSLEA